MKYISIGKEEGATLHLGGERHGTEGYFIKPTIFTDIKPEMKIVKEEIFGPGASFLLLHQAAVRTMIGRLPYVCIIF